MGAAEQLPGQPAEWVRDAAADEFLWEKEEEEGAGKGGGAGQGRCGEEGWVREKT